MKGEVEQEMERAIDRFVIQIMTIAERAAIECVQSAFVQAAALRRRPEHTVVEGAAFRKLGARVRSDMHTAVENTVVGHRIIAHLRGHPGEHIGQLTSALGIPAVKLRRELKKLKALRVIRSETYAYPRHRGRPLHRFFVCGSREPAAEVIEPDRKCQAAGELSGDSRETPERRTDDVTLAMPVS